MPVPALPDLERPLGTTAHDHAYRRLRRAIMTGWVRPGAALTIRGLAEAAGISPTPVREALRRLCAEGALAMRHNRRIIIPEMTVQRLEELIALRSVLERHAARRALPFVTAERIDTLAAIDADIDDAIARGDREAAVLHNQLFHAELYTANPDPIMMPMIESVWLQLGPFLRLAMDHIERLYTVDHHAAALAALRDGDEDRLAEAIDADMRAGFGGLDHAVLADILGGPASPMSNPAAAARR